MQRRAVVIGAGVLVLVALGVWYVRHRPQHAYYTGFVEGEERVIRSEVAGRVLEVPYGEGANVPADAIVARLDASDIESRIHSRRQEIEVLDADILTQEERVRLVESTWTRDVSARQAEVRQGEATAKLAEQTLKREQELVATGASTAQRLDDTRAQRDQARSGLDRDRELLARTQAEERTITLARRELESLQAKRELLLAQLAELEVTRAKCEIRAPAVPTVVQTQFIWPGELAQPGTAIVSVLDPKDKYVQVYVPVSDVAQFWLGRRVEIELDSEPGHRIPGEVSFVADKATFTPEKIETRSDRLGQVYRAKVKILEGVERLQPGTEGNVYLLEDSGHAASAEHAS
jgi:multidrug resistance efflux pump